MASNYSHRPVSPPHISDDNLASPVRIVNGYLEEGVPEMNVEVYSRPWHANRLEATERSFSCGRDCCNSSEPTSKDIVDLLPSNGMAWQEGYGLFSGWNVIWSNTFMLHRSPCTMHLNDRLNTGMQSFPSNVQVNEKLHTCYDCFSSGFQITLCTYGDESGIENGLAPPYDIGFRPVCNVGDFGFSNESASCSLDIESTREIEGSFEFEGVPHEAFTYILNYLGVKDLLSIERVCSSLSSAVRGDPLIWKTIHIDEPLNERITDDALVQLAGRAQGMLECLSLVACPRITNDGLRRVLEVNQRLTKLCVPGCIKFNIECIMSCIRAYNSNNAYGGIKRVRIGDITGMNREYFKELNSLLGSGNKKIESHQKPQAIKPYFHCLGNFYLPYDDDRAIDIDMCPRCEKFRLVYDCPYEECKLKSPQVCRACTDCIGRCAGCGRCINDIVYEETFGFEFKCLECYMEQEVNPCGARHG